MAKQTKDSKAVDTASKPSGNKKTAKEIVERHLKDKNDIITEEDLQNIQIITGLTAEAPLDITNKKNRPKDEDKDGREITPWDTISE